VDLPVLLGPQWLSPRARRCRGGKAPRSPTKNLLVVASAISGPPLRQGTRLRRWPSQSLLSTLWHPPWHCLHLSSQFPPSSDFPLRSRPRPCCRCSFCLRLRLAFASASSPASSVRILHLFGRRLLCSAPDLAASQEASAPLLDPLHPLPAAATLAPRQTTETRKTDRHRKRRPG
jgi:hypothetical protein